jgi:diguanylate cyclase (GGDEF)-like protein/PAS domain S-box-containing protein
MNPQGRERMDADFTRNLLDLLFEGVYFVDRDRKVTYWSKGAERITGYKEQEVLGLRCRDSILMHVDERGESACDRSCVIAETIRDGEAREADLYLLHKDGHRVPVSIRVAPIVDPGGRIAGAVEVFSDHPTKDTTTRLIAELRAMALLDPMTELGNRRYVEMQLGARLKEMDRYGWTFGVLLADIDRFKNINDTHGHDVGDRVLKMVGRTLQNSIRSFDVMGRWGGEEFLAVIAYVSWDHLSSIADKLRSLVEKSSFTEGKDTIRVTVSVGATLARPDDTAETLVKRADRLMYRSKTAGRNRVTVGRDD